MWLTCFWSRRSRESLKSLVPPTTTIAVPGILIFILIMAADISMSTWPEWKLPTIVLPLLEDTSLRSSFILIRGSRVPYLLYLPAMVPFPWELLLLTRGEIMQTRSFLLSRP